jgi:uncharacterized RDD family membrane protein YckC
LITECDPCHVFARSGAYNGQRAEGVQVFCPSCGVKNEGSPLKCFICGYILPSGERAAGRDSRRPARATANGTSTAEPFAAIGDRMLALILDRIVVIALLAIPAALLTEKWLHGSLALATPVRTFVLAASTLLIATLVYHIVLEALFGATLGKGLLGLSVRNGSSRWLSSSIRNVMRVLDASFFYALAFIVAVFSSRRQRIGDHLAGTIVVEQRVVWGARLALMFIFAVIVGGSLWLATYLCPSCMSNGPLTKLTLR